MAGDGGGAAEASALDGGGVTLHIRCFKGSKLSLKVSIDSTVGSFKSVIARNCDIPAEQQRLIYKGRILKDDQTLESYGLEADHTVHLVRSFVPATSTNTMGASNTGVPNSTSSGVSSVGSDEGGAYGGLFPGLGFNGLCNNGGLFGARIPIFEQVQPQLTPNPNLMREIIDTPFVQNARDNPDRMQNIMMNSPQMHELINRNPELAHILNDPSTVSQTLEAARNPELMREMMRNPDRAMRNIESSPEGFNMLRQMFGNVQEPFLDAVTRAGDTRNDLDSNPFQNLSTRCASTNSETVPNSSTPNSNPLPNPWGPGEAGAAQGSSTTRLNPDGDVRLPALGDLVGLIDYQPMFGSTQDTASLNEFMQNPAVSQIVQSLLSNPRYMNQQILTLRQTLQSQLGHQPSTREASQTGGVTAALDNTGLQMMVNMFGGLGTGTPAHRLNVPPEEVYAIQLSQLREMGFVDTRRNIQALIATTGNVHAAVERLLGNPGQ